MEVSELQWKNWKWEMHTVDNCIWMSCTEKHRKWETHNVGHGI